MSSKEEFKEFCKKERSLPLFMTFDWLETVAPENWDVVLEKRGEEIIAVFPYSCRKKMGLKLIDLPPLTTYGGIWIQYPKGLKPSTHLAYEKDIFTSVIEKIPAYDQFNIKFTPEFINWLPFYWKGFKQTTHYTYILNDLIDREKILSGFNKEVRKRINHLEPEISINLSNDIRLLYLLKKRSYSEKKIPFTLTEDYLDNIFGLCIKQKCGELLAATDKDGNVHCIGLFVWDSKTCYFLFSASDSKYKNSGAMTILAWEAIKRSAARVSEFNFAGSMIEDVERFVRSFGAKQTPYFVIRKTNSRILKIKNFLSEF